VARDTVKYLNHTDNVSGDPTLTGKRQGLVRAADMHLHTHFSDGAHSPSGVVELARKNIITTIAITDHDTVAGIEEAMGAGDRLGIEIIPGIELSAYNGTREVHILGYFMDVHDDRLLSFLSKFRNARVKRAREMVNRLNDLDIPVSIESVLDAAGERSVGRPHIANAVVQTGMVKSYLEVFQKYLAYGRPAYVEKFHLTVQDAIELIAHAGGLSFIAHPSETIRETVLLDSIKKGLDGIETVHPSLSKQKTLQYREIARDYSLLESGGSDFHGGKRGDEAILGQYVIPVEFVDAMRKRLVA
jgi:3',5'-nucleoside bisphosphate phosphatase